MGKGSVPVPTRASEWRLFVCYSEKRWTVAAALAFGERPDSPFHQAMRDTRAVFLFHLSACHCAPWRLGWSEKGQCSPDVDGHD